jgi:hypothetical protein
MAACTRSGARRTRGAAPRHRPLDDLVQLRVLRPESPSAEDRGDWDTLGAVWRRRAGYI